MCSSKEMTSLKKKILTEMKPSDPDWEKALREAMPGRMILTLKRSGEWKARGVKQGFREDKIAVDGPDFSYYSNVVKFHTVRLALA